MKKSLLLIRRFIRIAFCNLTHSRINFLGIIIYWIVSLAVLVIFWKTLFQYLPSNIGDWDFSKLCILNSMCYISWGIFVLFWGFHQIPQKVITGELDKFLARPISPLLGLIGEEIRLIALYEIMAGIMSLIVFLHSSQLSVSLIRILLAFLCICLGTLIVVFLHGVISLSSFWFGRIDSLQNLIDSMDEFQKYPLDLYPSSFRWFLIYFVPLYFPGSFAARILLNLPIPIWHWVSFFIVICVWGSLFTIFYRKCLYKYEANG